MAHVSKSIKFARGRSDFYTDLRKRVDEYFKAEGQTRNATPFMIFKTFFWAGGAIASFCAAVFLGLDPLVSWALAAVFGFFIAGIGFNIGHDAIHGSYSKNKRVNGLMSWSFDLMGASSYTWSIAHNFVHHTYTNVPEKDDDIEQPFIHLYRHEKRWFIHRFQHFYGLFLYCFTTLQWLVKKDFKLIMRPDPRTGKRAPTGEIVKLLIAKSVHVGVFLVLPLVVVDLPAWQIVIGYLTFHAVAGFTLAIVFQCAHVVKGPEIVRDVDGVINDGWAEHQLKTTANFGGGNPMVTFICGGLDYQIEHHLFPKVCHVHYPKIAPIVRQAAEEAGLPYLENPTFFAAAVSHLQALKDNGAEAPV